MGVFGPPPKAKNKSGATKGEKPLQIVPFKRKKKELFSKKKGGKGMAKAHSSTMEAGRHWTPKGG